MPENIDESQLPHLSAFERIKHLDTQGGEWWSARELMLLLTYSKWQDFHKVVQAAIEVYRNSGGEDRKPTRHGFQNREAPSFGSRGQDKGIAAMHQMDQV